MQLKRIAENTVDLYINRIIENLGTVKVKYQIPEADWERYTNEIAITIFGTNGSATKRIQKEMMLGTTGIIMVKALLPTVGKISSKVVVSLASKVGAKTATKTGALVAGKLGAQLIDPIAAVGIIAWDIWDYNHSVDVEKPILRQAVAEYLDEVKYSLLDNHENENSIMSCIYQVEDKILNSLEFKG